ncbi:MAG: thioredoxin family protein [Deltaproteobacteria bacterium]|nr:thioredoxin family protein [Deltaproteobacteria bacterium]
MSLLKRFFFIALVSVIFCTNAKAYESPWVDGKAKGSSVRIIGEFDEISSKTSEVKFAVEFKLKPRWHIYWKNPGYIGYPPKVRVVSAGDEWSSNLLFPAPIRMAIPNSPENFSFGFEKQALYPLILINHSKSLEKFEAEIFVDYLICEIQCVPESAKFKIKLPIGEEKSSPLASTIENAVRLIPQSTTKFLPNWKSETELQLHFGDLKVEDIFYYAPDIKFSLKKPQQNSDGAWIISSPTKPIKNLEWTAVWSTPEGRTGISGSVVENPYEAATESINFYWALFFAFVGGMILNLMPCVLPVVMLKTLSLLKWREKATNIRSSLLLSIAGILASFSALAGITILFQSLGHQVGWGFQFQSPMFVTFLIVVIFLFALNLFELFEFHISSTHATKLTSFQGPFFEGVFATLLATPCSAPFLGTALSFALSKPPSVLFLFFIVMGLGLSTPFILFTISPRLLHFMPKPGHWMHTFKRILGYSLLATVLWLLYVVHQQTENLFLFMLLSLLALLFVAVREFRRTFRWILVAAIGFFGVYTAQFSKRVLMAERAAKENAEIFSESQLKQYLENGRTVFVEITADWCLTCKFNEKTVIENEWFQKLLKKENVVFLKADWTQRDEAIGAFLKKYDRAGIPFAMLISKNKTSVFPELLTRSIVEERFQEFFK